MSGPEENDGDDVFVEIATAARPMELLPSKHASLRERVLDRARETAPEGTRTLRANEGEWVDLDAHVRIRVLSRDEAAGTQTVLMRVAAGGRVPGHRHTQEEEFIVLEGECHIGAHRLGTGDVHLASAGSWHDDITTHTGVLVMVRGELSTERRPAAG
ncbi:MAG: cupin domain-containing protein [Steroidobacteraceae bacterium]|nr:cupin domain-containing protein [Steroidobacteraceae bacterium]